MKIFSIFLIWLMVIYVDGKCELEGVNEEQWETSYTNIEVEDSERILFKEFNTRNINAVTTSGDYNKYFTVTLEENVLTIAPSKDFENYEINEEHVENPKLNILMTFTCDDGARSLTFFQPIKDLNTYEPSFSENEYSYKLPMPLPADFNLQCLMDAPIHACDSDISNTKLNFEIEPKGDFAVTYGVEVDEFKRCHTVVIKTSKPLTLQETTTYELIVTDIGNPAKENRASLIIEIDEETAVPSNPQFNTAYYTADYDNTNEKHSIEFDDVITLEKDDPATEIKLVGDYQDKFEYTINGNIVTVSLKENLPDEVVNKEVVALLTLEATIPNAEGPGRTALIIYMPKQQCPTTTTPLPTTACPTTETPTECPVCPTEAPACPTTEAPTECPVCPTEAPVTTTACPTTEAPTECPVCPTEAPVNTTSCPTTETSTECPVCPTEAPACPTSEAPTYTTEVSTCPTTECPVCTTENPAFPTAEPLTECPSCTTESSFCPTIEITTECPVCVTEVSTDFTCPSCTTECPPCTTTSNTITECPSYSCPPSTITDCPPCVTTLFSTDCPTLVTNCPPCLTTPVTPGEPFVEFLQNTYTFRTPSGDQVVVGEVKAIAIPSEELKYSIKKDGENPIPSQLSIDQNSGVLTLNGKLEVGLYKVLAHVIGMSSQKESTAHVEINIYIETETSDVLIVKTIPEDAQSSIPLPCPISASTCVYTLKEQFPVTTEPLFKYQDGNLVTEAISLEMPEIKDFLNPQFTLNLELTNVENSNAFSLNKTTNEREETSRKWLYLPEYIPRTPSTLLVSVIVEDINNHSPVFEAGATLIVGYPVTSILNGLSPPYLVKVQATDLDRATYADIRYSSSDSNFIVHPKTGVVYPGENAFDGDINKQFSVIATDMDGAEGGKSATLTIDVKLLTQQQLTYLTLDNILLEDLDDVIAELSTKTELKINYLTATVVPKTETESSNEYARKLKVARDNDDYGIKLVVYAFDKNNEPVDSDTLQQTLEETEDVDDLTASTWSSSCDSAYAVIDTTGFVAAISVLASLLVIFIIMGGVLYYLKIYKKRQPESYDNISEEDSASIKYEKSKVDNDEESPKRRPTGFVFNPPPVEEEDEEDNEGTDDRKYESIPNKGWNDDVLSSTYNDPIDIKQDTDIYKVPVEDDKMETDDSLDGTNTFDSENPSRKSVSFKPIVEKINIVVDNDKEEDIDVHL